ncbi:MAG: carbamoyl phosphate synthase small subunit [Oscillospiraceae bacterium]|nr:carbamoyl phosphate synthase small subunit [Oscillospiraceae bacterium]
MNERFLILQNGMVFKGQAFGARGDVTGEIVFTTGMTGYIETLTDPSFSGQIILHTFPLIGNYGIISEDFESQNVAARGYIVKYPCQDPSNFRSEGELDTFLQQKGVVGLHGIDTRALTKILRNKGVMGGRIVDHEPTQEDLEIARSFRVSDVISDVSCKEVTTHGEGLRIAMVDFGTKAGIIDSLVERGCEVTAFPYNTKAETILNGNFDGIMLSNGPGDPADCVNKPIIEEIRKLMDSGIPTFGICMGHLFMALAQGYKTQKLKFGHRGANQPVKEVSTGKIYITSQNHGYAVATDDSAFTSVNDGTCEGLDYGVNFSVQFHPEARGGPLDTEFLFDRFLDRVRNKAGN